MVIWELGENVPNSKWMNTLRRGVAADCCSAAPSGTMHSRNGSGMQLPMARSACRRLISQDCERKLAMEPGSLGRGVSAGGYQRLRIRSDRATARTMSLTR